MKITGIIAEYNPFHNGHKYHLEQARSVTGADFCIVVMGGDFMQRGVPAVTDKYRRAEMALLNGADLVLELPLFYAAGSAEYFAMGAVSLLDKLGAVDSLCFGSECGSISVLTDLASLLKEEPEPYRMVLQKGLKTGLSFPKARSLALEACLPSASEYSHAIVFPNNILGVEYIKALLKRKSAITPYTVRREGSGYHDPLLASPASSPASAVASAASSPTASYSSASAIRLHLEENRDFNQLKSQVPASVFRLLEEASGTGFPITGRDFSLLLRYRLLTEAQQGYTRYLDVTPDLSDKIKKNLNRFEDFEQFCTLLKSRDMTYSRISRSLLHILLGMTGEELEGFVQNDYISYARILGFRRSSVRLLGILKKSSSIPLISKLADASSYLTAPGCSMLEKDILAAHIYDSTVSAKFHTPFISEYERRLILPE